MLNKIKNRKQEGFTIIEVLIVLAIAGLIMLIVFLAVPALQRNSRNTQRQADASKITTAISSCLSARNGKTTTVCDTVALLKTNGGLDTDKLQQIEEASITPDGATPSDPKQASFQFGKKCKADGSALEDGTARQAAVLFLQENASTGLVRCIDV